MIGSLSADLIYETSNKGKHMFTEDEDDVAGYQDIDDAEDKLINGGDYGNYHTDTHCNKMITIFITTRYRTVYQKSYLATDGQPPDQRAISCDQRRQVLVSVASLG